MTGTTGIRAGLLTTAALMSLPGIVTALNDVEYHLRLSDQSPVLAWNPMPPALNSSDTDSKSLWSLGKSWVVSYSRSSWDNWTPGSLGVGVSQHTASWAGVSSVGISFVGTAVTFLGGTEGSTLVLEVDQSSGSASGDGLASTPKLSYGAHQATLSATGGTVSVNEVIVTTSIASEATTYDRVPFTDMLALDGDSINGAFATVQSATGTGGNGPWDAAPDPSYPSICSQYVEATATFTVPPNTAFLELWGSSGLQHGKYDVTVTPTPPKNVATFQSHSLNPWENPSTLLYFAPLDPTTQYSLTFRNLGRSLNCLHKARVYSSTGQSANATASGSSSAIGLSPSGSVTSGMHTTQSKSAGTNTNSPGAGGVSASATSGSNVMGDNGVNGGNGVGDEGSTNSGRKGKSNTAAIAGGVVGGLVALAAVVALLFVLRRRKNNQRSRTQAMYKATSISGRDRPSSWAPFLVGSTSAGSTLATWRSKDAPNNNMEMLPGAFASSSEAITTSQSRHTSLQTFDSSPMTPPVGEFGTPILPNDEISKLTPTSRGMEAPYASFAHSGSHTSIPSQASLPPISEMPSLPPQHTFATSAGGMGAGAAATHSLTSPSSDTVDSQQPLPPGWPSPPTSPPRLGPRPPPRRHARPGSLSPPSSPNPPSVGSMPLLGRPGSLFD